MSTDQRRAFAPGPRESVFLGGIREGIRNLTLPYRVIRWVFARIGRLLLAGYRTFQGHSSSRAQCNWFIALTGGAACAALDQTATALPGGIMGMFMQGLAVILKTLVSFWMDVPGPNLSSGSGSAIGTLNAITVPLVGAGAVIGLIIAGVKLCYASAGQELRNILRGLLLMVVTTGAGATIVGMLVVAFDELAKYVLEKGFNGQDVGTALLAMIGKTGALGVVLIVVLCILGVLSSLVQVIVMVIRGAILALLVGLLPIAAGAAITDVGYSWFKKVIGWIFTFVIYKLAAALLYATAFLMIGKSAQTDTLGLVMGLALLGSAMVTLPALLRLMVPAAEHLGGGGGGASLAGVGAAVATGAMMLSGGGAAAKGAAAAGSGASSGGAQLVDATNGVPAGDPSGSEQSLSAAGPNALPATGPRALGSGGEGESPSGPTGGGPSGGGPAGGGSQGVSPDESELGAARISPAGAQSASGDAPAQPTGDGQDSDALPSAPAPGARTEASESPSTPAAGSAAAPEHAGSATAGTPSQATDHSAGAAAPPPPDVTGPRPGPDRNLPEGPGQHPALGPAPAGSVSEISGAAVTSPHGRHSPSSAAAASTSSANEVSAAPTSPTPTGAAAGGSREQPPATSAPRARTAAAAAVRTGSALRPADYDGSDDTATTPTGSRT